MITNKDVALKILKVGKAGFTTQEDGFKKLDECISLIDKYVSEQLISSSDSHCACTPDETTGTTTVRCCNICGKPAESFWRCG